MSTVIRPEISDRSPYYVSKHRYYELKHFCLQYPEWKAKLKELEETYNSPSFEEHIHSTDISDPTEKMVEMRERYSEYVSKVVIACDMAAGDLAQYLLLAVTEGRSYENLQMVERIPCCREVYYDMYRKFFWHLERIRD